MSHPVGRPSKFKPEYVRQAAKACQMGATDDDLADLFDVTIATIWNWKAAFPDFLDALKSDKAYADNRVERSLYQRAVGYTYDAVKIFNGPAGVVQVPYREHVPPDPTSCLFWLKNRRREEWRDTYGPPPNSVQDNRTFTITIGHAKQENMELPRQLIDVSPERETQDR
jgi:hypothetical protein